MLYLGAQTDPGGGGVLQGVIFSFSPICPFFPKKKKKRKEKEEPEGVIFLSLEMVGQGGIVIFFRELIWGLFF